MLACRVAVLVVGLTLTAGPLAGCAADDESADEELAEVDSDLTTPRASARLRTEVTGIIAKVLQVDPKNVLQTHRLRADLGADDIDRLRIMMTCESVFDFTFATGEWRGSTVGDVVSSVNRKLRASGATGAAPLPVPAGLYLGRGLLDTNQVGATDRYRTFDYGLKATKDGTITAWVQGSPNRSARLTQIDATTWAADLHGDGTETFRLTKDHLTFAVRVAVSGGPPLNPVPGNAYNPSTSIGASGGVTLTKALLVQPL